jgi:hypothetical protein
MSRALAFAAGVASFCFAACSARDSAEDEKPIIPQPVTFTSGSRLKAKYLEIDGVKLFNGWEDTKTGRPCVFSEGRCLTGRALTVVGPETFEDDTCTTPIFDGRDEPEMLLVDDYSSGCRTTTVHSVGERLTLTKIWIRNNGQCIESAPFPSPGEYVRVGPAIAPESEPWVRATEQNDPSDGRIVARWRVADDGARELIGAWDSERNEVVAVDGGTNKRWYPQQRAALIGEATCSGIATSSECKPTSVFLAGVACRDPQILSVGARAAEGRCPASFGTAYEVGSSVPAKSFADAKRVEVGGGRIRLVMDARNDDKPIVPRGFFDTEAQAACSAIPIGNGDTFRCVWGVDSRVSEGFADEACTQKAIIFARGGSACDAPPTIQRYLTLSGVADTPFEVGAQIYSAWRRTTSGECERVELTDETTAHVVTPIDPSRFPVLTAKSE